MRAPAPDLEEYLRSESMRMHARLESALAQAVTLQDWAYLDRLHTVKLYEREQWSEAAPASYWALSDGCGLTIAGVPTYSEMRAARG